MIRAAADILRVSREAERESRGAAETASVYMFYVGEKKGNGRWERMEQIDLGPVYLRPIRMEDTDDIVRWRNEEHVRKNFFYRAPFTPQGHREWMEKRVASGEVVQFILCEKEGDRPVGSVYFRDVDRTQRKAEYGIFIGEKDGLGKGYGTLAAQGAVRYAEKVMGLHKLMLRVFADNTAARKSYERAGFEQEGLLREDFREEDGSYRDVILMAALFPQ